MLLPAFFRFRMGVEDMNYSLYDERSELTKFCEGDSVRAFDYFGARFVQRDGVSGVLFRVWAPNALSVSVAGDFNGWDREAAYMSKRDCGVWEQFIPNVLQGQSYQYCIETPTSERIMKADPFAFFAHKQPKRASRVYDINGYEWSDAAWRESRRGIDSLKVVYSPEEPVIPTKAPEPVHGKRAPGSNAFTPSVMGLIIAGEVVKDIIER